VLATSILKDNPASISELSEIREARKVLAIYSYRDNLPWQKEVRKALFSRLEQIPRINRPQLFEERLEVNRLTPISTEDKLLNLIVEKYSQIKLDLIVTDNDYAFSFLNKYPEAFPAVKRTYITLTQNPSQDNVLSVKINPIDNIKLILRLMPKTNHILVLANNNTVINGLKISFFESLVQSLSAQNVELEILSDFSFSELNQKVKTLSNGTVIFHTPIFMDRLGKRKIPKEVLIQLVKISPVPIFVNFDPLLETGVVGGYLVNSSKIGGLIADAIIGLPLPKTQQQIAAATKGYYFDDNALKRWHISHKSLPDDSVIINRKVSVWYTFRKEISLILIAFIFETMLIIALLRNLKLRKNATAALKKERDLLEDRVLERTQSLAEKNKELEDLTLTDPLTGISNRRDYQNRLDIEVANAKRSKQFLSCLMIDVDFFKPYNDNYGHALGDEVLKNIAAVIHKTLPRETDFVARYGGEEFVVLMPATDLEGAKYIANNIRVNIESSAINHAHSAVSEHVTVSIGISASNFNTQNHINLVKQADDALYFAKEAGRNRYEIFTALSQLE